MAHSRFLNLVLVFVTVASIFSTFAEANRGFGWGWGGGSNYSSSSGSSPGSGWGWGSSQNGSGWSWGAGNNYSSGSGSSPGSGWSWGWGMGSNHSSRSGSSPWSGWGWGWGPKNGQNSGSGGSGSGWGWGPKNTNNSGSGSSGSSWGWGGHSKGYNATYNAPRKIIVGGDKEWTYGFNYSVWASKTAPFFLNDILGEYLFYFLFSTESHKLLYNIYSFIVEAHINTLNGYMSSITYLMKKTLVNLLHIN